MRTAIFLAASVINEGLLAIARSNDFVVPETSPEVLNFVGWMFVIFVLADLAELTHKLSK